MFRLMSMERSCEVFRIRQIASVTSLNRLLVSMFKLMTHTLQTLASANVAMSSNL